MPDSGRYGINEAVHDNVPAQSLDMLRMPATKVSQLNESEQQACPYIVAGSICIMEGKRSWTCIRHRRIVCEALCIECRLVLTRAPGI